MKSDYKYHYEVKVDIQEDTLPDDFFGSVVTSEDMNKVLHILNKEKETGSNFIECRQSENGIFYLHFERIRD